MRKYLITIFTLLTLLFPLTVSADKTNFFSNSYDFKKLHNIELTAVNVENDPELTSDKFVGLKVGQMLEKALQEKEIPYSTSPNGGFLIYPPKFSAMKVTENNTIKLTLDVHYYGYKYITKEGYWEDYTEWVPARPRYDRNGRQINYGEKVAITRTRWVPPRTVKWYFSSLEFTLMDGTTPLACIEDKRSRDIDNGEGMLQRTVNDFVKTLKNLHDKGKA